MDLISRYDYREYAYRTKEISEQTNMKMRQLKW